jgi:hypothetical protein
MSNKKKKKRKQIRGSGAMIWGADEKEITEFEEKDGGQSETCKSRSRPVAMQGEKRDG